MRHERDVRGVIFEPFWSWINAGQPTTEESERGQFSAAEWWLVYMFTGHWHPCYHCAESVPQRVVRLLKTALEAETVGFSDDERVMLDDANTQNIIEALDELERPPTSEWWHAHYAVCPERIKMCEQLRRDREAWERLPQVEQDRRNAEFRREYRERRQKMALEKEKSWQK
jgi:hypothetical protein